ncbi:reverse transcriptase domain-containing protein [Tanacetum coccineum]
MSGSPTPSPDPVVESLSPSLTPFGDSDFLWEETDAFLSLDDSIPSGFDNGIYDSEGDILFLEELLNEDPTLNLPPIPHPVCLINETAKIKSSIDDPPNLELKDLPPHLEYAYLEGTSKLPVIIAKDLKRGKRTASKDDFKPAVQHQRWVNPKIHEVIKAEVIKLLDAGLIYPISDSPWKLTEAPILVSPDWDLPFELMCDASDYAVGAVLGQRKGKYFSPIHYANHSALKYLFNKQDAKPRLLRWILLLQEFTIEIRDKKGAENLAADYLSRLENPYQDNRVGMEINDNFPHESLNMISLNPDNEPSWFADIANSLVGNVLVKGMSSQQKKKFFKDI